MERDERIALIKEVAARLAEGSLTDCDLMLNQFGFSTHWIGDYDDDRYAYAVDRVSRGSDDQIRELHRFASSSDGTLSPGPDGSRTWGAGAFRLFISHTHAHRERAGRLRDRLLRWGVDAFVAHDDIEPTREWENEILTALRTCDALCALITPDFVASRWCDQEVGVAVARGILVLPLKLGTDPHGFIAKYQAITVPSDATPYTVASLVFGALAGSPVTAGAMVSAIVRRYANSGSYDDARAAFALLQTITDSAWTEAMMEEAERAATENSQVRDAYLRDGTRVEGAVAEILKGIRGDAAPLSPDDDDIPF